MLNYIKIWYKKSIALLFRGMYSIVFILYLNGRWFLYYNRAIHTGYFDE